MHQPIHNPRVCASSWAEGRFDLSFLNSGLLHLIYWVYINVYSYCSLCQQTEYDFMQYVLSDTFDQLPLPFPKNGHCVIECTITRIDSYLLLLFHSLFILDWKFHSKKNCIGQWDSDSVVKIKSKRRGKSHFCTKVHNYFATMLLQLVGIALVLYVAYKAYRNHSLSYGGAITAVVVGCLHIIAGWRYAVLLLFFFGTRLAVCRLSCVAQNLRNCGLPSRSRRRMIITMVVSASLSKWLQIV